MSRQLLIKGTFKNGKYRTIGAFNGKGCEHKESLLNDEDIQHIIRVSEQGEKCFNWNIEKGKFKKIEIILHCSYCNNKAEENKEPIREIHTIQVDRRIDTDTIRKYIDIINKIN